MQNPKNYPFSLSPQIFFIKRKLGAYTNLMLLAVEVEVWGLTPPRILGIKSLPGSGRKIPFQLHWLQSWTIYQHKGQGVQCLQAHLQQPALQEVPGEIKTSQLGKAKGGRHRMGWSCPSPPQAVLGDAREQPG